MTESKAKAAKKMVKKETVTAAPDTETESPQTATESPDTTTAPEEKVEEPKPTSEMDPDDEKRTGVKDVAVNSEGIAAAEGESDESEKEPATPSFFIKKDQRRRVEVDVLTMKKDGSVVSVARNDLKLDYSLYTQMIHTELWFEFTMPNFDDMSGYRQKCGIYRREAGQVLVDRLQLRNFLVVWHLKDWNVTDSDGKKVELKIDLDGSLSESSITQVYSMHSSILDVVLTIFEKDLLLT